PTTKALRENYFATWSFFFYLISDRPGRRWLLFSLVSPPASRSPPAAQRAPDLTAWDHGRILPAIHAKGPPEFLTRFRLPHRPDDPRGLFLAPNRLTTSTGVRPCQRSTSCLAASRHCLTPRRTSIPIPVIDGSSPSS